MKKCSREGLTPRTCSVDDHLQLMIKQLIQGLFGRSLSSMRLRPQHRTPVKRRELMAVSEELAPPVFGAGVGGKRVRSFRKDRGQIENQFVMSDREIRLDIEDSGGVIGVCKQESGTERCVFKK